jgi:hypothetical protein
MKKLSALLLGICLLSTTACKSESELGECVGFDDDEERDPTLKYELSARNAFWSFIGIETIVAPVLWVTDFAYCPEKRRATPKAVK